MNFKLILGGPGTGKTEHLIRLVERELQGGLEPHEIAFVAFTRAAANEARERAARALSVAQHKLPHFRTLHSMCFRELGLRRSDVLDGAPLRELEKLTGERMARDTMTGGEAGPWEIDGLARNILQDSEELASAFGMDLFRHRRAIQARDRFKAERGLVDFTDMLEDVAGQVNPIKVKLAIIDEVQDLTPLQWNAAANLFKGVPRVICAGDDDQAIHEWAGSTIQPILDHTGECEVLAKSHRLPREIYELSQQIISPLTRRLEKATEPSDHSGAVRWYLDPLEVDFSQEGTWLFLCRARFQLETLKQVAKTAGLPYLFNGKTSINTELLTAAREYEKYRTGNLPRWHDALQEFPLEDREYILAARRRGEKLNQPPRVQIETIHGAKGRQADHVLLLTDLTARIWHRMQKDLDAEVRVQYVGLTRARRSLHLIQPSNALYTWRF